MTVAELIAYLQKQPQELTVIYKCYSEAVILEQTDIQITDADFPRPDGWIHSARPDKPTQQYLCFPGN